MRKLLRIAATAVTALSLTAGAGGAVFANSASIGTTGPDSYNTVEFKNHDSTRVHNDTSLHFTNNNPQTASSGNVKVKDNTTGGDAASGGASNNSSLMVSASVDNTGSNCGCNSSANSGDDSGDINLTGPNSTNKIKFENSTSTNVDNDTNISITNNNTQKATSGSVDASHNTTVGDATSGDASNTSNTSVTLNVTN